MFKLVLVMVAALQLGASAPQDPSPSSGAPASPFQALFKELVDSLPLQEIREMAKARLATDPKFQAAVAYFQGEEWKVLMKDIKLTNEWEAFKNFLFKQGVDLAPLLDHYQHCLKAISELEVPKSEAKPSVADFIAEVKTTQGVNIIMAVQKVAEKVKGDENLKLALQSVTSADGLNWMEAALNSPSIHLALQRLREMDAPVDQALEFIYSLYGKPYNTVTTTVAP